MNQSSIPKISSIEFMIVGTAASLNDLCDWIGLDLLFFRIIDLTTACLLGSWCFFRFRRFPAARFGGTFLIELTPVIGDLSPTWTLFIISLYAEQKGYYPQTFHKLTKPRK